MPRRLLYLLLLAGMTLLGAQKPAQSEGVHEEDNTIWKIANFAIFAGGIGYVIFKFAPAFFNARSADIQKAIKDATGLKMEADLRYSETDRRMANLAEEVGRLRAESQAEMDREYARLRAHTAEEIAYIQKSVGVEIEAQRGDGAAKLRVYATEQALAAAEDRLRERFASADQKDLVGDFLRLVETAKGASNTPPVLREFPQRGKN
jgi:F0F1-type ATP synthase membrane subunit b/b'